MTDSYLAPAPAPRQLDIIADTILVADIRPDLSTAPTKKVEAKARPDLSTAMAQQGKAKARPDLSIARIRKIEAQRKTLQIPISKLLNLADVTRDTYFAARRGISNTRAGTLDKLEKAIRRIAAGQDKADELTICQSYLVRITRDLAKQTGWDPDIMVNQDFSTENTNDPIWLQASRLRRCAIYLVVEGLFGGKRASVARAVGMTRQGVHKGVAAIEAARMSDDAFDAMMQKMINELKGNA